MSVTFAEAQVLSKDSVTALKTKKTVTVSAVAMPSSITAECVEAQANLNQTAIVTVINSIATVFAEELA